MLVTTHGMTARVMRGILLGLPLLERFNAPIADGLPQGSMVAIRDGVEEIITLGAGARERA